MTRIVHFSDIHICAPLDSWQDFFDKRIAGLMNFYTFRKNTMNPERIPGLISRISEIKPDLIVCTGDITCTGRLIEFSRAIDKLSPLLAIKDSRFIYVPGNHDKYVRDQKCLSALHSAFRELNGKDISLENLPVKIKIKDCEFILVDETVPTNIFSSCGYISKEDSLAICRWAKTDNNTPKILVGHFPIKEMHPIKRFRKRLWGQKDILEKLVKGEFALSLCGHFHHPYADLDEKGRGEICAGSFTLHGKISVIEYIPENKVFTYRVENIQLNF